MDSLSTIERLYIMSFLTLRELLSTRAVCSDWNQLLSRRAADMLWRQHIDRISFKSSDLDGMRPFIVSINGLVRTDPDEAPEAKRCDSGGYEELKSCYRNHVLCGEFFDELEVYPTISETHVDAMDSWEMRTGISLPDSVYHFMKRTGISRLVHQSYPTNNFLAKIGEWGVRKWPDTGHVSLKFLNENQGCCYWHIKWRPEDGDVDPPVYVVTEDYDDEKDELVEEFNLDNPHFSSFCALMAKDGMQWYRENPGYEEDFSDIPTTGPF